MKNLAIVLCSLVFVISCRKEYEELQTEKKVPQKEIIHQPLLVMESPEILFEETEHDYGRIPYDGNGIYEFAFENIGNEPLKVINVKTSCGVTAPDWPRDSIQIGQKSAITVKVNTKRVGEFNKTITVYSNAITSQATLVIKGSIDSPTGDEN